MITLWSQNVLLSDGPQEPVTDQVPDAARQLAGRLVDAFETDRVLAERLIGWSGPAAGG
jgi:hypothetical protein